ncbi:S-adenosyl-L-methionine-dependent methyltransferase [Tuber indicum]|nr:S-adenosyl-L-methionine-dependent methyltransferase [Tuber indicum]
MPPLPIPRPSGALRTLATAIASPNPAYQVFNRRTKCLQRSRSTQNPAHSRATDYLKSEISLRLIDRVQDIQRPLPHILDLGAGACHIARQLPLGISSRLEKLTCVDMSRELLYRDAELEFNDNLPIERVVVDEEVPPFAENTFDAVISSLSMHWINDLPYTLSSINRILKPDAPFIAAMLGGDTLFELRTSLQLAELERRGGVSPRVSPLADVRDVGGLMQRAGFKLLTIDVDDVVVEFPDVFALMADLNAMGEGNAVSAREVGPIGRDVLMAAEGVYRELHGGEEGRLPATFRVIYMIGWKEGENQPKPLPRGSGEIPLKDILEGEKE